MKNFILSIYAKFVLLIFSLLSLFYNEIRAQTPHISGIVIISTEHKIIGCDLKYSNLPQYSSIMLFRGMSKPVILDANGKRLSLKKTETLFWNNQYVFSKIDKAPSTFSVKCRYKQNFIFKLISDKKDWMGNIAFNDSSIRASWSSAWYPVLYDSASTVFHSDFTYDIRIVCEDCKTIYLNGSLPVSGTIADFKSDAPVPLLLYAGAFDFRVNDGLLFVNSPFSLSIEKSIDMHIKNVEKYFEEKLQIKYGTNISIVYARPTNKKTSLLFISFPSIVALDMDMKYAVDSNNLNINFAGYLTHEIGHYYFGSLFFPNNTLFWAFLEGFTSYLELKANQSILSSKIYDDKIKECIKQIEGLKLIPLSEITDREQINFVYRYKYMPLLLTAIEMEIGEEKMWKWLNIILTKEKNTLSDYRLFRETLLEALEDENLVAKIENKYIKSQDAKKMIMDRITF